MRGAALLLLLLLVGPLLARAEDEKPPPDPIDKLPAALRPGAEATFTRSAGGGRLAGTVAFRAEKGIEKGTVRLFLEYDTGDKGPLTRRDRMVAVLDAKTRRIVSFTYEVGGKAGPLRVVARLGPHPKKADALLHERIRYDAKGKARTTRTRIVPPPEGWVPDLLEPFLWRPELRILTVERGRLLTEPVKYESLGTGKLELGGKKITCLILQRVRGDEKSRAYVRAADHMPVRNDAARIQLKVDG